jgi:hypothetical protein
MYRMSWTILLWMITVSFRCKLMISSLIHNTAAVNTTTAKTVTSANNNNNNNTNSNSNNINSNHCHPILLLLEEADCDMISHLEKWRGNVSHTNSNNMPTSMSNSNNNNNLAPRSSNDMSSHIAMLNIGYLSSGTKSIHLLSSNHSLCNNFASTIDDHLLLPGEDWMILDPKEEERRSTSAP